MRSAGKTVRASWKKWKFHDFPFPARISLGGFTTTNASNCVKTNEKGNEREFVGGDGEVDEIHDPLGVVVDVHEASGRQQRDLVVHDVGLQL